MFKQKLFYSASVLAICLFALRAEAAELYSADDLVFAAENGVELVYTAGGNLFSGAVILPDAEGRPTTFFYKNGKKDGVAATYFDEQKVAVETTYKDGLKNGIETAFYPNGEPQYQCTYKNGLKEGACSFFYENGKPQKAANYSQDVLNGSVNYFDEEGNHIKTETYKNGTKNGIERIIENNVLIAENTYVNGRLHGVCKQFDTKYLTDEFDYVDGVREGEHKHYAEDGTVSKTPYHNNVKNGIAIVYYPDKTIAQITTYINGKKGGTEKKLNLDGKVKSIENYLNDQLEGIAKYFDKNGKLQTIKYFVNGTESGSVNPATDTRLASIYPKFEDGTISQLFKQRNLWYRVLWLGISTDRIDLINSLENAMKMYVLAVDDLEVYQRFSGTEFTDQTAKLYFGMTPFMYAVSVDAAPEILQKFVSQAQLSATDGETPLQSAIRQNKIEAVKILLQSQPNISNKVIDNLLFYALKNNIKLQIVELLIAKCTNINVVDKDGKSPLDYALENNMPPEGIAMLLKAGADIHALKYKKLLAQSLRDNRSLPYINLLLEANVEVRELDENGKSALYYTLANHYPEKISDELRKRGAKWNKLDIQNIIKDAAVQSNPELLKAANFSAEELAGVTADNQNALQYAYQINAPKSVINYLLSIDIDINHQDNAGNTLLFSALTKGDRETVMRLLQRGAAVDLPNRQKETVVSYVLKNKDSSELSKAVWKELGNADPLLIIPDDNVPLWKYLYLKDNFDDLKNVFDHAKNPLSLADEQDKTIVDMLIEHPDDERLKQLIMPYLPTAEASTLWKVIKLQNSEMLEQLPWNKTDIHMTNADGETLLTHAVKNKVSPTIINFLLSKGADVNQTNSAAENAMDAALNTQNKDLAILFIQQGADVNKINHDRSYIMDCLRKDLTLTDLLINRGADISHITGDGETTLIAAVKNLNLPLIKYILKKGIDSNLKDSAGNTAVLYLADAAATHHDDEDLTLSSDIISALKLLSEHGANINQRNEDGRTVLMLIALQNPAWYSEFEQEYSSLGGNMEMKDQYGRTAADYRPNN